MRRGVVCGLLLCGSTLWAGVAVADSLAGPRLSGYGTLAYAMDDQDDLAPMRDLSQRPQDNFATGNSWRLDSRLGLQVDHPFHPQAEWVAQFMLRDQIEQDLGSVVELAYLGLMPRPDLDVRLGRLGFDVFLMSDHRNLGYAYTWVRPPQEFHSWIPVFSVDGLDAAYSFHIGDARWRIKAQAGVSQPTLPIDETDYEAQIDNLWTLTLTRTSGPWRVKLGFAQFQVDNNPDAFSPLLAGLAGIGGAAASDAQALSRELAFKGGHKRFVSLGAAYDDGRWIGQAELGRSFVNHDILASSDMAYAVIGRRFQDWTPFAMAAYSRPTAGVTEAESDWGADEGLHQVALDTVNSTRFDQKTLSLGVRWDFHDQAALKLQWDHTWIGAQGYGTWFRAPALNGVDSQVDLWTVSLDFVF